MPTALITGVTGQDGSHLADFLLDKRYRVFGLARRSSGDNTQRLAGIREQITLLDGDLLDQASLLRIVERPQHACIDREKRKYIGLNLEERRALKPGGDAIEIAKPLRLVDEAFHPPVGRAGHPQIGLDTGANGRSRGLRLERRGREPFERVVPIVIARDRVDGL